MTTTTIETIGGEDYAVTRNAAGTIIAKALHNPVAATPIVDEVTMRQARRALHAAGLLASVEAALDALSEPARTAARIDWDASNSVKRSNTTFAAMVAALGLTDTQVDDLFVAAKTYTD